MALSVDLPQIVSIISAGFSFVPQAPKKCAKTVF